jgi:membrane glycosyltransferase
VTDAVATVKTTEHGDASALPEINWTWRRYYVFAVTATLIALVYWITYKTVDIETLKMIARYALWLVFAYALLYVAGSTTTDITGLVAAFRTTVKITEGAAAPAGAVTTAGPTTTATATAPANSDPVARAVEMAKGVLQEKPPWLR